MTAATTTARDPQTPPEELARLAAYPEFARDVASNANTPLDTLLQLAEQHPREVMQNPAFELALATGEVKVWRINRNILGEMIATREAPEALLALASEIMDQSLDAALLFDPRTPRSALNSLAQRGHAAATYHVNAEPQHFESVDALVSAALAGAQKFPQPTEALMQALRPLLPAAAARALATAPAPEARLYAATSEHLEPDTLRELTTSENFEIAYEALRNPSTPADALEAVLGSNQIGMVLAASVNPNLPREALDRLLAHDDETIAATALKNPQLSDDELRAAADGEPSLAALVALGENPRAPLDLLTRLAASEEPVVRAAVARNPRTPEGLRAQLAKDDAYIVKAAAELNPTAAPIDLAEADSIINALQEAPQAAIVLAATLDRLPMTDPVKRSRVAWNLTTMLDPDARLVLAANPATPQTVLEHLAATDADQRVRYAAQHALES